jgi:O-antigen/teichoic acid export membrane protein
VVLGQIPETIVKPLIFISIISILFIFSEKKLSPPLAMSFQVIAAFCAFIFGSFLLICNQPKEMKAASSEYETRKWLKIIFPFMFLGMIQVINKQTDIVMLGLMRSSAEVGIYQAVVHGSNLISFVLVAVNTAQAPQIARLWSSGKKQQLQQMLTATARIIALATVIASVTLIFGGQFFLFLLFGQEFTEGFKALQILCMGQIVNGLAGSVGSVLHMTGHEIKALQAMGLSAVINIVLNLYLVPRYGMEGAALATAISLSVWNILMVILVKKYTGLNSTALGKIQK